MCKNTGVNVQAMNYGTLGQNCIITQEHEHLDDISEMSLTEIENRDFNDLRNHLKSFDLTKQLQDKIIKPGRTFQDSFDATKEFFFL